MINIDIQELKRLYYDEQKSGYEIAQHFQTIPSVIYDRMRKHGLQRRPAADGQKLRYAKPTGQFPTLTRSYISTLMRN